MNMEIIGGEYEFERTVDSNLRLLPIAFGEKKTSGNEPYFHAHPSKALAAMWSRLKKMLLPVE